MLQAVVEMELASTRQNKGEGRGGGKKQCRGMGQWGLKTASEE